MNLEPCQVDKDGNPVDKQGRALVPPKKKYGKELLDRQRTAEVGTEA
jgi:hypothetical protein